MFPVREKVEWPPCLAPASDLISASEIAELLFFSSEGKPIPAAQMAERSHCVALEGMPVSASQLAEGLCVASERTPISAAQLVEEGMPIPAAQTAEWICLSWEGMPISAAQMGEWPKPISEVEMAKRPCYSASAGTRALSTELAERPWMEAVLWVWLCTEGYMDPGKSSTRRRKYSFSSNAWKFLSKSQKLLNDILLVTKWIYRKDWEMGS